MDKIFNEIIYIILDEGKFIFNAYAGKIIVIYEQNNKISYEIKLLDKDENVIIPEYEVYTSLIEAQKEAKRLTNNATLFRLAFY